MVSKIGQISSYDILSQSKGTMLDEVMKTFSDVALELLSGEKESLHALVNKVV